MIDELKNEKTYRERLWLDFKFFFGPHIVEDRCKRLVCRYNYIRFTSREKVVTDIVSFQIDVFVSILYCKKRWSCQSTGHINDKRITRKGQPSNNFVEWDQHKNSTESIILRKMNKTSFKTTREIAQKVDCEVLIFRSVPSDRSSHRHRVKSRIQQLGWPEVFKTPKIKHWGNPF